MRSTSHWTPRYVRDRIAELYYQRSHPDHPWLTRTANDILESYLRPTDAGIEFGSGRSTIWFGRRSERLISVEHDGQWHDKVRGMLSAAGLDHVDYRLVPRDVPEESGDESAYARVADELEAESLDWALVDGVYRDACALHVLDKLRPGGVLIIDNVNWYLPSPSRSPSSRSLADGPNGPGWVRLAGAVERWRRIWTSSGVTDTALFFKPCG